MCVGANLISSRRPETSSTFRFCCNSHIHIRIRTTGSIHWSGSRFTWIVAGNPRFVVSELRDPNIVKTFNLQLNQHLSVGYYADHSTTDIAGPLRAVHSRGKNAYVHVEAADLAAVSLR